MADASVRRVYEIDVKLSSDAVSAVREMQKNLKDLEDAAKKAGKASKDSGKDAEDGGSGFNKLNFATVGARRELLVLVHELSQGNFQRFGGSLLVLGERIDATRLIMSAAGLSVIALGAAIAGIAVLVVQGALEQDKFNKSLTLTGNAAGQTAESVNALATSLSDSTNKTKAGARAIIEEITATGRFGPSLVKPATEAVIALSRASGESAEDIVKDFTKMGDGVIKWADEHNRQYHYLTLSERDYIKQLEDSGKTEEAVLANLKLLTDHLGGAHVQNLGYAERAWNSLKSAVSSTLDYFRDFGKKADITTTIATKQAQLTGLDNQRDDFTKASSGIGGGPSDKQIAAFEAAKAAKKAELQADIESLNQQLLRQTENAGDAALKAYINEQGIERQKILKSIQDAVRDGNKVEEVLTKYRGAVDATRAAYLDNGKTLEEANKLIFGSSSQAQDEELIKKKYGLKGSGALENAVQQRLKSLGEEDAALREQIKQYDEYGRKLNNAALAKVNFDIANGKFKGASPADQDALRIAAQKVDQDQDLIRQREGEQATDKRIAQLRLESEATTQNARDTAIAVELGKLETSGIEKGTAAYESRASIIKFYVNQIHDQIVAKKLLANEAATDDEATRLREETDLIGKSTLERQKLTAVLQIESKARKEIAADPSQEAAIRQSAARQIETITAAINASYDAHRTFEAGTHEVFAKYIEDATNAASFTTEVLGGGIKQLEDVFVNFAKTGKLNFSSLFQFMADEFIRQSVKMTFANVFKESDTQSAVLAGVKGLSKLFGLDFGKSGSTPTDSSSDNAETAKLLRQQTDFTDITKQATDGLDSFKGFLDDSSSSLGDFGNSLADAASSILDSFNSSGGGDSLGNAAGSFDWGSLFDFAKGGIMSSSGKLPVNTYAGGGIANKPQLAIFGEGRMNEAYVPLPDGRSIPVNMRREQQGGGSDGLNVTIENHNGSDVSVKKQKQPDGKEQLRVFVRAAKQAMLEDVYAGGDFDRAMSNKYGVSRATGTPRLGF